LKHYPEDHIKEDTIDGESSTHETINANKLLVRHPEGKIPLGRPRHSWEDNLKMDFKGTGWKNGDWINLT
jgi:hypothetical protein